MSRSRTPLRWLVGCTALILMLIVLNGCLPLAATDRSVAIGSITITEPLFTPIIPDNDAKTLDFGMLKSESSLWASVSTANFSASSVSVGSSSLAAQVQVAGPSIDNSSTHTVTSNAGKVTSDTQTQTNTTTQKTPTPPSSPTAPTADTAASSLSALLAASGFQASLTPDEKATLVASYQAYMQSLEQFAFQTRNLKKMESPDSTWMPYTVQFRISVDPGWYSLKRDYDAVADIAVGDDEKEVRIVSVMPSETAQIIQDFQASLRSFALALAASGAYGPAAGAIDFKTFDALAQRLEGARINTSFIVAYPASNRMRIRFRPSLSAERNNLHDLQPTTKLLTAVLLLKNGTPKKDSSDPGKTANKMSRLASKVTLQKLGITFTDKNQSNNGNDDQEQEPRSITLNLTSYFAPSVRDHGDGNSSTPIIHTSVLSTPQVTTAGDESWVCGSEPVPRPIDAIVPEVKLPADPKPAIKTLLGYYQPIDDKTANVAVAYQLSDAPNLSRLEIRVAGATTTPSNGGIQSITVAHDATSGLFNVPIAVPPQSEKNLPLPVQFILTPTSSGSNPVVPIHLFGVINITLGPDDKPAADASVQIKGMDLNDLHVKLSPASNAASGSKIDVKDSP